MNITTTDPLQVLRDWYPARLIKSNMGAAVLLSELLKAKYIRREPTGNKDRPWRYIYHRQEKSRWQAHAWEAVKAALREDQKEHGKANAHEDGARAVHFGAAVAKLPMGVLKLALAHLEATHGKKAIAGMKAVIAQVEGAKAPHVTEPSPAAARLTASDADVAAAIAEAVHTLPAGVKSTRTKANTESMMGETEIVTRHGVTFIIDPNVGSVRTSGLADQYEKLKNDPTFRAITAHVRDLIAKIRGIQSAPPKAEPPLPELAPAAAVGRLSALHDDLRTGSTIAVNGKNYRVESIYQKLSGAKEIDAQEGILGNGKTHKIVLPKRGSAGDVTIREMYPKAGSGDGKVVRVPVSQVYPGTASDAHVEIAAAGAAPVESPATTAYNAASAELSAAIDGVYGPSPQRAPVHHQGTWKKGPGGEWMAQPSGSSGPPQVGDTIAVTSRKGRVGQMVVTSAPDARGLVSVVDPKAAPIAAAAARAGSVSATPAPAPAAPAPATPASPAAAGPSKLMPPRTAGGPAPSAGQRLADIASRGIAVGTVVQYNDGRPRKYAVSHVDADGHLHLNALSGGDNNSGPSTVDPHKLIVYPRETPVFEGAEAAKRERVYKQRVASMASLSHSIAADGGPPAMTTLEAAAAIVRAPTGGLTEADRVPGTSRERTEAQLTTRQQTADAHFAKLTTKLRAGSPLTVQGKKLTVVSSKKDDKGRTIVEAKGARGAPVSILLPSSARYMARVVSGAGTLSPTLANVGVFDIHPTHSKDEIRETHRERAAKIAAAGDEAVKHTDTTPAEREAFAQRAELIAESDGRALARQRAAEDARVVANTAPTPSPLAGVSPDSPSSRQLQAELGPRAKTKPVEVREAGEYNRQARAMWGGSPFRIGDKQLTRTDEPGEADAAGGHTFTATDAAGMRYKVKLPSTSRRMGASITPEGGVAVGFSLGAISAGAEPPPKTPTERADAARERRAGDDMASGRSAAKGRAANEPWTMDSSTYRAIQGADAPHIGEISSLQRKRMSKRAERAYDADRAKRSDAASAAHDDWRAGVAAAFHAGKIDSKTPGLSRDAKSVIFAEQRKGDAQTHSEYRDKWLESVSKDPEPGDIMYHPMHGHVEVTKKNKNSVSVNRVGGSSGPVPAGTVDPKWLSYGPPHVMEAGGKDGDGTYKTNETRQAEHKEAVDRWETLKRELKSPTPPVRSSRKVTPDEVLAHAVATKDAGAGVHRAIYPNALGAQLGISTVAARRHLDELAAAGKLDTIGQGGFRVPYEAKSQRRFKLTLSKSFESGARPGMLSPGGPTRSGQHNPPPDTAIYGGHLGREFLAMPQAERQERVHARMQEHMIDLNAVFALGEVFGMRPPVNAPVAPSTKLVIASRERLNAGAALSPDLDTIRPYLRRD